MLRRDVGLTIAARRGYGVVCTGARGRRWARVDEVGVVVDAAQIS